VYRLGSESDVVLSIHDVSGRRLAVLDEGVKPAGLHTVRWAPVTEEGNRLPGGVYFAVMRAGGKTYERKLVLQE
jgi:flagellar hook assembly protein FlgD